MQERNNIENTKLMCDEFKARLRPMPQLSAAQTKCSFTVTHRQLPQKPDKYLQLCCLKQPQKGNWVIYDSSCPSNRQSMPALCVFEIWHNSTFLALIQNSVAKAPQDH